MAVRSNDINVNKVLSFCDFVNRKKVIKLQKILHNDLNILKIMVKDIEQRIIFIRQQHVQLHLLRKLKSSCDNFDAIITKDSTYYSVHELLAHFKFHDLSSLSFSMHQALQDCFEFVKNKSVHCALTHIQYMVVDLLNLQEKKLLITDLQLTKIQESLNIHYVHYHGALDDAKAEKAITLQQYNKHINFIKECQYKIQNYSDNISVMRKNFPEVFNN